MNKLICGCIKKKKRERKERQIPLLTIFKSKINDCYPPALLILFTYLSVSIFLIYDKGIAASIIHFKKKKINN